MIRSLLLKEIQTVSVGYSGEIISSINGIDWISRKTGTEDYLELLMEITLLLQLAIQEQF